MLTSLVVKDFALIENLEVDFNSGLTIVTGETGAGKSILIDALGLVLGDRSDTTMIRDGAQKTIVEAVFDCEKNKGVNSILHAIQAESQPQLIIRREVSAKGQSRCFVNDTPVSVSQLKLLGDLLVDVHGQHEHQSLLNVETHIEILDSFGEIGKLLEDYQSSFNQFKHAGGELKELYHRRQTIDERRAVVEYQLREINKINPSLHEDEEIDRELRVAEHAERLAVVSNEILDHLYDGENSVVEKLGRAEKLLDELSRIDVSMKSLFDDNNSASAIIEEIVRAVRDYASRIAFDPAKIEAMRVRLGDVIGLKRKFGGSLQDVLTKRDALQTEYDSMDSLDEKIDALEKKVEVLRKGCSSKAEALSEKRNATAAKLAKQIESILRELGITHPIFKTMITFNEYSSGREEMMYLLKDRKKIIAHDRGWDAVEFYLSTNLGEEVKPLTKVVSGGEVSRIMLAIKSILAEHDRIPLLVFDEIDVGVSGKIAQKVGTALKKLSHVHQIIAITHLPQIAALGDVHLVVEKIVSARRTFTTVKKLKGDEREMEIARLMSGQEVTKSSLQSAKELMNAI